MEQQTNISPEPKRSYLWLTIVLIVIVLAGGFYLGAKYLLGKNPLSSDAGLAGKTKVAAVAEKWTLGSETVLANITSTDTFRANDGSYRMFLQEKGGIYYKTSPDGLVFSSPESTGISEDEGMMISNPSALQLKDGSWILIYEQSPISKTKGPKDAPPGPATQRNLYLASSPDGKTFTKGGVAIDSSKQDDYSASVPDLVLLPSGKIRMYYVSGGNAVGSAISADNGKTWTREEGYRLEDAVDPNVSVKTANGVTKWVMYYSVLSPDKNNIYKATSTDGLTWEPVAAVFDKSNQDQAVIDPDVVEIAPDSYVMYYGQTSGPGSTGGEQINLYKAVYQGDIFR